MLVIIEAKKMVFRHLSMCWKMFGLNIILHFFWMVLEPHHVWTTSFEVVRSQQTFSNSETLFLQKVYVKYIIYLLGYTCFISLHMVIMLTEIPSREKPCSLGRKIFEQNTGFIAFLSNNHSQYVVHTYLVKRLFTLRLQTCMVAYLGRLQFIAEVVS